MQHGPGTENAFGGVAQAYGESVPILVLPMGYPRRSPVSRRTSTPVLNLRHITKSAEPIIADRGAAERLPPRLHRASRTAAAAPVLIEIPRDVFDEEVPEPLAYTPAALPRVGPDPEAVRAVADACSRPDGR